MSRKIAILIGSPRRNGNTSALAGAFADGARSAGHEVTELFLGNMDIRRCLDCFKGDSERDYPCVQKDDMAQVYPVIRECDVVVLASPLHYWNLSGQLLTTLGRLFALEEGEQTLRGHGRGGVLLMAAEGHGFEDAALYFDHLMEHLRWENLGRVLCGGVMNIGDIDGHKELEEARQLGASL